MKRILALFSMAVWTLLFRSILSIPWSVLIMKIFQEKSLVPMGQDPIITPTKYSAKMRWMAESSLRSVHRTHCIACWTLCQDWNWRDWMIPNWFLYITSTRISDTVILLFSPMDSRVLPPVIDIGINLTQQMIECSFRSILKREVPRCDWFSAQREYGAEDPLFTLSYACRIIKNDTAMGRWRKEAVLFSLPMILSSCFDWSHIWSQIWTVFG